MPDHVLEIWEFHKPMTTPMTTSYESLTEHFKKLSRIEHAITYLSWDQMVMMPEQGVSRRADAMAELAAIHHDLLTADDLEEKFASAAAGASDEVALSLREMKRVWSQATCLPAELVKAKIQAGSKCEHGWRTQRGDNDWNGFLGNFKEVLELGREEARLRQAADPERFATPYDAMLDLHCSGDSKALIDSVFGRLREELPGLLKEVVEKQEAFPEVDISGDFEPSLQQQLNHELMSALGFDFDAGRLDESVHPFSTGGVGDLRITTRFTHDGFLDALLATAHETGHASYEGGLPQAWEGLPVGGHRNMSIHESQSLLFEKQILLSRAFMTFFTPRIQSILPQTAAFSVSDLWQAATRVKPGYIRVDADEVTYPLHVMLRYEIESDLINGDLEAEDIPDCWNEKMQSYLGLSTAGNYTDGCMQDIHWTDGAFGYFPSYTLGAVNGAQIFAAIKGQYPDWQERLTTGDTEFIRAWLEKKIWSQGSLLESQPLMQAATGQTTSPEPYLQHLRDRYLNLAY